MNLRDSDVEDDVRKRPFSNKISTRHPFGPFESAAKLQLFRETSKVLVEKSFGCRKRAPPRHSGRSRAALRSERVRCSYARQQVQLREAANAAILQTLGFTFAEPKVFKCEP